MTELTQEQIENYNGSLKIVECKWCGKPLAFKLTKMGSYIPVNPDGLFTIVTDRGNKMKGHLGHFHTCPHYTEDAKLENKI